MPTYQYRCDKCGKKFERSETISEHETSKANCPKCGSKKVSQVPGNVFVVTSKKS
jgi:putative FmdB family regulatory protein